MHFLAKDSKHLFLSLLISFKRLNRDILSLRILLNEILDRNRLTEANQRLAIIIIIIKHPLDGISKPRPDFFFSHKPKWETLTFLYPIIVISDRTENNILVRVLQIRVEDKHEELFPDSSRLPRPASLHLTEMLNCGFFLKQSVHVFLQDCLVEFLF